MKESHGVILYVTQNDLEHNTTHVYKQVEIISTSLVTEDARW